MARDIQELLDRARGVEMSAEEREVQRRSFAYGNAHIENPRVSRESIAEEAEKLAVSDESNH